MTNPTESQQDARHPGGRPVGHVKSAAERAALSAGAKARWAARTEEQIAAISAARSAAFAARRARTPDMVLFETAIKAIEKARKAGMEEEDIQEILAQALGLDERPASKSESWAGLSGLRAIISILPGLGRIAYPGSSSQTTRSTTREMD